MWLVFDQSASSNCLLLFYMRVRVCSFPINTDNISFDFLKMFIVHRFYIRENLLCTCKHCDMRKHQHSIGIGNSIFIIILFMYFTHVFLYCNGLFGIICIHSPTDIILPLTVFNTQFMCSRLHGQCIRLQVQVHIIGSEYVPTL